MAVEPITGFHNYTADVLYTLRGLFASETIDSRPIKLENTIIWLDAEERIHRYGHPAIERADGSFEFWEHGLRQYRRV